MIETSPVTDTTPTPTPSRYRYLILAAAVVMQMCLGATYAWSMFVDSVRQATGIGQGPAQAPFTVFYLAFPATMILAGPLLQRIGPRICAMLGGLIFGGGWIVAGLGSHHFIFTVLGVGLFGGIGVGLAYIVPIATGMLWFPKNKGLVTGFAVAGFGGGAALVSQTARYLMGTWALSPFQAFAVFGLAFATLVVLAGSCMRYPPDFTHNSTDTARPTRVLREPAFWLLYLAMFAGLVAGFTVNANLKQLIPDLDVKTGALAVSLFAIANAAGRVCWGFLADRAPAGLTIRANLVAQALLILSAPWLLPTAWGLPALAVIAGFNYGGVLVLYASATAQRWGSRQVGTLYGWLFSANIPAALAPLAAGLSYDVWGTFAPAFVVVGALLLAASACVRLKPAPPATNTTG